MEKEMICIVCPVGCHLKVHIDEEAKAITVSNNKCNRGPQYAQRELTNPTRTICSTVKVIDGLHPLCPVKTAQEIPKDRKFDVINALKKIEVKAPIHIGDVIVKNVCGLDVDVIATRNLSFKRQQP